MVRPCNAGARCSNLLAQASTNMLVQHVNPEAWGGMTWQTSHYEATQAMSCVQKARAYQHDSQGIAFPP
eukprot:6183462-Pleurochrysis_carterae.AAC.4